MSKTKQRTSLFFSGVLILTFSNVLIKLIGVALKIPLHNILGGEGMGYYNTAYDIYVWLYMVSTAGLPVAVSIMVSESRVKGNFEEVKKIFRIVLTLFLIIGGLGMCVMLFGSRLFAGFYNLPSSYYAIMAIAPTLFFICISSAMRGYFQGYQNMFPTAISQIIEAVGKMALGILLAKYALSQSYALPVAAAYAIAGVTVGVLAGMLFLCIAKLTFRANLYDEEYALPEGCQPPEVRSAKTLLKRLVMLAVPITISSSIMSLTTVLDSSIISHSLESLGYIEEERSMLLGNYRTLAVSLFNLPPALIYPISYSIVPLLSATINKEGSERARPIMESAYKVAALIALPCSLGLSVLAKPILSLLFTNKEAVESTAPLLSVLSLSIFFIGMLAISNAVLQANNHERLPIISMIAGSAVKLITSSILISNRNIEMYGAPIGTFLCYMTIVLVNFYFVAKHVKFIPNVGSLFFRPLAASVVCAAAGGGAYWLLSHKLSGNMSCLLSIAVAVVFYLIAVFLFGAVKPEDVRLLPKGQRIEALLRRLILFR